MILVSMQANLTVHCLLLMLVMLQYCTQFCLCALFNACLMHQAVCITLQVTVTVTLHMRVMMKTKLSATGIRLIFMSISSSMAMENPLQGCYVGANFCNICRITKSYLYVEYVKWNVLCCRGLTTLRQADAGSLCQVSKCGELYMKKMLTWKRLMCYISEGCLLCYTPDSPTSSKPRCVLPLLGYDVTYMERDGKRNNVIRISHVGCDSLFLAAHSRPAATSWIEVRLNCWTLVGII